MLNRDNLIIYGMYPLILELYLHGFHLMNYIIKGSN